MPSQSGYIKLIQKDKKVTYHGIYIVHETSSQDMTFLYHTQVVIALIHENNPNVSSNAKQNFNLYD